MCATKTDFLNFPATNFCTTIMSLGPPFSGKTYMLLKSLKYFLDVGMFERYVLILPQYKNEMEGSYDWLENYEHVHIYESFHEARCAEIIKEQEKNKQLFKAGKLTEMPRIFFCIDDATGCGTRLFKSTVIKRFATENRHLSIHSWFLLHYDKGILDPKVRNNILWFLIYPLKKKLLEHAFDSYIEFEDDFDDFDAFRKFWDAHVKPNSHGFLLIKGKERFNPNACKWFDE